MQIFPSVAGVNHNPSTTPVLKSSGSREVSQSFAFATSPMYSSSNTHVTFPRDEPCFRIGSNQVISTGFSRSWLKKPCEWVVRNPPIYYIMRYTLSFLMFWVYASRSFIKFFSPNFVFGPTQRHGCCCYCFLVFVLKDRIFYANGWAPFLEKPELLKDVNDRLYCVSDVVPKEGPGKVFNASLTKIFMGPAGGW